MTTRCQFFVTYLRVRCTLAVRSVILTNKRTWWWWWRTFNARHYCKVRCIGLSTSCSSDSLIHIYLSHFCIMLRLTDTCMHNMNYNIKLLWPPKDLRFWVGKLRLQASGWNLLTHPQSHNPACKLQPLTSLSMNWVTFKDFWIFLIHHYVIRSVLKFTKVYQG